MRISHIKLTNWRNFREIDVPLAQRQFIVGANASGKSNFLDVFRFLRDIAKNEGGGLQKAVRDRGGVTKLRSLAARRDPVIKIAVTLQDNGHTWDYSLAFTQQSRGTRSTVVTEEVVHRCGEVVLSRPDDSDGSDPERLTQTSLEQINANATFREIAAYFQGITYLHLVPQLLRFSESLHAKRIEDDPFGQGFLERIAATPEKTRNARLRRIESAMRIAVPNLQQLQFVRDSPTGHPHLTALYSHWRPKAGWQREDQFSDGTLRLIAMLWSLLDGDSLLLLEEPELSLNDGIVRQLAALIHRLGKFKKRQVLISTHSEALLRDQGIDGKELLLLVSGHEGTEVRRPADIPEIARLLESGLSVGEVVLPRTEPANVTQLSLFNDE